MTPPIVAAGFALLFFVMLAWCILRNSKDAAAHEPAPPMPKPKLYRANHTPAAVCVWCGRGPHYHHPRTKRCIDLEEESNV